MGWRVIVWFCRLVLGLECLAATLGKSLDLPEFVGILRIYRFFTDWAFWLIAFGITGLK